MKFVASFNGHAEWCMSQDPDGGPCTCPTNNPPPERKRIEALWAFITAAAPLCQCGRLATYHVIHRYAEPHDDCDDCRIAYVKKVGPVDSWGKELPHAEAARTLNAALQGAATAVAAAKKSCSYCGGSKRVPHVNARLGTQSSEPCPMCSDVFSARRLLDEQDEQGEKK